MVVCLLLSSLSIFTFEMRNEEVSGATMESRARPLPSLPLSLGNRKYTWAGRGNTVCVVYVQKDLG